MYTSVVTNTIIIHNTITNIFQERFVKLHKVYHYACSSSEAVLGGGGLCCLAITSTSYAKSLAGASTKMVSNHATKIRTGV